MNHVTSHPKVTVCVAVKQWNAYMDECFAACQKLEGDPVEFIVFPDTAPTRPLPPSVKCVPTGPVGPAEKRDLSLQHAQGEIIAFLDDDTYPVPAWLNAALKHFDRPEVAAVGGPAVTPPQDDIWQQASGAVYESMMGGGPHNIRYVPRPAREVDDFPSCNLLIRKSVFAQLGGFQNMYWPGEDTILCLKITKELGLKIIYDPGVLVYHHRRRLFLPHLKQVANYALHRGFFAKKFPETSRRLSYFLPSILLGWWVLGGIASLMLPAFLTLYKLSWLMYGSAVLLDSIRTKARYFPLTAPAIVLTHITYGAFLLKGLLASDLRR